MNSTYSIDFLIVGQGLAGSILALTLLEHGQRVCIFNDPHTPAASSAAAGLFNPITGKRMSKTWLAEQLFPFLEKYYPAQEQNLGSRFFYPMPLYRPFVSVEEQNTWISETAHPDVAKFAEISQEDERLRNFVNNPHGGMMIRHAGYVDVKGFLQAARKQFVELGIYRELTFDYGRLQFSDTGVRYEAATGEVLTSQKILFCDGPHAVRNPFFGWLPFRPVKGEVLRVGIDNFPTNHIINQHLFLIPLPDGTYRAGATYNWRDLTWENTEAGTTELLEKLTGLIKKPVRVLEKWAGVRPATVDRRPLVGLHPTHSEIGFFGGMGSKGVSLIPFFAQHFVDFLLFQKDLLPAININRYISLYKS